MYGTRKEVTREYFNNTADCYDESHDGKFVRCMYDEIVKRVCGIKAEKILDLGCGNGNILRLLYESKRAEYYGLDLSENMIGEAKKRLNGRAQLAVGDAEHLPYGDSMFDVIICNASFHHYTSPEAAVSEMRRVLRQGGSVILGDPTLPGKLFVDLFNLSIKHSNSGDVKIWHKKEIIPFFESYGFQVVNWKKIKYRTFIFQAIRV